MAMRRSLVVLVPLIAACGAAPAPSSAPPSARAPTPTPPAASTASPVVAADVALRYDVFFGDRLAGHSVVVRHPDGAYDTDYAYTDRGRGPSEHVHTEVAADGVPSRVEVTGTDYLHSKVHEIATCDGAHCAWENENERSQGRRGFYMTTTEVGIPGDVILRAVKRSTDATISLLPSGALRATRVAETTLERPGEKKHVIAWEIAGLGLAPKLAWFDDDDAPFATVDDWMVEIREGWKDAAPTLIALQKPLGRARREKIAKSAAHRPSTGLAIVHARLFDPAKRAIQDEMTILIEGKSVTRVAPNLAPPAGFEIIDAKGKTVLPGFWDMHTHPDDEDGLLHIAEGITTARDLGNEMASSLLRAERWEQGTELGPHLLLAGLVDGRGPNQGPIGIFVDTPDEARAAVDTYAGKGYAQIKIYSSLKPELVPIVVAEAHAKGLRVSGHVPAHMIAEDAIKAGFDEIQHINFLVLDLVADRDTDTRTPLRLTIPAEKAGEIDIDGPKTNALMDLLVAKHTVVDPTLNVFEADFTNRPGKASPALAPVLSRLPTQVQRLAFGGGLPVPEGFDAKFRASFERCEQLVKRLWARHVPIVAGTDSFAGFSYHRELELYSELGIPNADVLTIATLGAARVMKRDAKSGSILPGKDADLVIVDGDPLARMSDVRKVVTVVKAGTVIDSSAVETALSIGPR